MTDKADCVKSFDRLLSQGLSQYNCYINKNKTMRNYSITDNGSVTKSVDGKECRNGLCSIIHSGMVSLVWSIN